LEKRLLGALLCFAALSYRRSAGLVGGLSSTAVRNAFIALRKALPKPESMYRRCIAVDETKSKLGGEQLIIWAARDVDTRDTSLQGELHKPSLDAELLLKQALECCENKHIFIVDKDLNIKKHSRA